MSSLSGGWALDFAESSPKRIDKIILIDSSGLNGPDVLEWELLKVPLIMEFLKG